MDDGQRVPKRPRRSVQAPNTYSKEFPEGYGDFILQSTDGMIFHFPRFLLSHMSPIFKDMYQAGRSTQNSEPLKLAEDHLTIEQFLCHIDPAKETPQLDWQRVTSVLEAADKYQVISITKWFEKEVFQLTSSTGFTALPHPMLCLQLGRRYNLTEIVRLSLRELIKCPLSEITGESPIESMILKRIISLRAERTQSLVEMIYGFQSPHSTRCPSYYVESKKSWKKHAIRAAITEPSLSAIVTAVERLLRLNCKCVPFENTEEMKKLKSKEKELPQLSDFGW
jgi:hypothetical protein